MESKSITSTSIYTESILTKPILTEEDIPIPMIHIDRTEEFLKQLVEINIKGQKCLKFTGENFKMKKLDENFKYNCIIFDTKSKEIVKENENLPNDKLFIFQNSGDTIGKKQEKHLLEKFDDFPICVTGQIQATFKDSKNIIFGTGTLIGSNIVLTSASNLFRKNLGKIVIKIKIKIRIRIRINN
jgi:hypothetical protein